MIDRIKYYTLIVVAGIAMLGFVKCGGDAPSNDPMKNKGIGPVKTVTLGEIDNAMANEGKEIFDAKCTACHKIETKYIGPAIKGVTVRRTPEWIMNMILNPEEMLRKDPIAKQLIKEYAAPMANQGITYEEARKLLEYFRTVN